jgi:heme-degrading monooxygenase HmoA
MFAVIFEVQPKRERWDDFLGFAKLLKPELEKIEGFIDNERFKSRRTEGRLLSLSTWADEKAVVRWRSFALHHQVQEKGRFEVFEDYHLRVGEIIADTDIPAGHRIRNQRLDETEVGTAKRVTLSEGPGAALLPADTLGLIDQELFDSLTIEGKSVLLAGWRDAAPALDGKFRQRRVRVIRDYGMADRREAPQYYPAVGG